MKHYFWERPSSPKVLLTSAGPGGRSSSSPGFFLFQSCLNESNLGILHRCSSSRHLCNLTALFWFWFSGWEPQKHKVS